MPRWVVCSTPDCGTLHTGSGRCQDCRREHEQQRGTRQQRGYGAEHDRLRARYKRIVDRSGFTCWRCRREFPPGAAFQLGHDDEDRSKYRGLECPPCNLATAGRK